MSNVKKYFYQTPIIELRTFGEDVITTSGGTTVEGEESFEIGWIEGLIR